MNFYSPSLLKQQSADRHVAQPGHTILIPSSTVFVPLFSVAYLAEKQQLPIFLVFGLARSRLKTPRPTVLATSTLTITPPMRFTFIEVSVPS